MVLLVFITQPHAVKRLLLRFFFPVEIFFGFPPPPAHRFRATANPFLLIFLFIRGHAASRLSLTNARRDHPCSAGPAIRCGYSFGVRANNILTHYRTLRKKRIVCGVLGRP